MSPHNNKQTSCIQEALRESNVFVLDDIGIHPGSFSSENSSPDLRVHLTLSRVHDAYDIHQYTKTDKFIFWLHIQNNTIYRQMLLQYSAASRCL